MAFIRTKIVNGRPYKYKVKTIREKQPDGSDKIRQKVIKYLGADHDSKNHTFKAVTSSNSVEWYTPPEVISLVRELLGEIHIDPASSEEAQAWIKATVYYTSKDNGLNHPWRGNLWLNPPYGSKNQKSHNHGITAWCHKAIEEYDRGNVLQGVLLVGGTSEGVRSLRRRFVRCEPRKRISFISPTQQKIAPPPPPTFYYLGDSQKRFQEVFSAIGDLSAPL